ncbi:hypothetical protein EBM89_03015 [Cellulomonas triticagri]|uniref:Uncharacterized protein n=1 Tax=Cellulomonas triticagri TaxID=2483352 RepID=A0A3M2JND6_9CELL|nr:hypothetical protein EBM89_03015 [Cellulomonas triticagri]
MTSLANGTAVDGFAAPDTFDPLTGYPATVPAESTPEPASFAGTIGITDPVSGQSALAYCIDLFTDTQVGVHYALGSWDASNVANLGYVGYVLENYFPTVPTAPAAASDDVRAAAVQAAIWFFSDRYVLDPASPVRPLTEAIVADALANGPAVEPAAPQLDVSPDVLPAPSTGELVGPFQVTGDGPATLRSVGVEVYSDPDGTTVLPDGATVAPGTSLWSRSVSATTPQGFVLERAVTVVQSSVYLYDGSNPGRTAAQKLVLAQTSDLVRRAGALLEPYPAGSVTIDKTVAGTGAGLQGEVVLTLSCTPAGGGPISTYQATIEAGAAAGTNSRTIGGIPAGASCAVEETTDGDNGLVTPSSPPVVVPSTVTIAQGATASVAVTNTYDRAVGSLQVTKTIAGAGAGLQGIIVIDVDCAEGTGGYDRTYTIDRASPAGAYAQAVVAGIPAGTVCEISETDAGGNGAVVAETQVSADTVTLVEGLASAVAVTNTYSVVDPRVPDDPTVPNGPADRAGSGTVRFASDVLAASGADPVPGLRTALMLLASGVACVLTAHMTRARTCPVRG